MNKKSVLHIHQKFLPYRGGSTQRLLNLISRENSKFKHVVICENSENVEDYSKVGNIEIYRYSSYTQIPLIILRIKAKYNFDIVHYHNYRPAFYGLMTKIVFPKARTLFELHSIYIPSTKVGRVLSRLIHYICDAGLVLSEASMHAIRKQGFHRPLSVVYNGVDLGKFKCANKNKDILDSSKFLIGYIGSIEAFQGVDAFCRIANKVSSSRNDVKFIVVGGNKDKHSELKEISQETVDFYEFFPPEQVPTLYKSLSCLLMTRPSLPETESAVPLKPIEALGAGIPVLSTNVGGMIELKQKLKSDNINLFDSEDEIINYLSEVNFNELEFTQEANISIFDVSYQSKKLESVYMELLDV